MMKKLTLGILGAGKLSALVVEAFNQGLLNDMELLGICSRSKDKSERLAEAYNQGDSKRASRSCSTQEELLALQPDYIVEAASPTALRELALPALSAGISLVTLSIGALADPEFLKKVKTTAKQGGARVHLASGATGGFDVLRTAALMGGAKATFFNEKGPGALKNTPVYREELQQQPETVFSGTASEAIGLFPTRINVAVAASLASVGPDKMQVTIQSTPGFTGDTQRVEIVNEQVKAVIDVYSATAEIAGWSVVSTLQGLTSPLVFG